MDKYLISHLSYRDALEQASMMGIKKDEFIYVSMRDKTIRQNQIMGRRVSDEKYLIGHFTDGEKEHLIRYPRPK